MINTKSLVQAFRIRWDSKIQEYEERCLESVFSVNLYFSCTVQDKQINPRPGGLQLPKIFLKQLFLLPNKLRQTLQCNHFYILYASFDVYEVKLGDVVWVYMGSSKEMVDGVGETHDSHFVHFFKYLTRYVL